MTATDSPYLHHGGGLREAADQTGIPLADWLDLSTGISPYSWQPAETEQIPLACWQRLPETQDGLEQAACRYLGLTSEHHLLPIAGSQAAIQLLPWLRTRCHSTSRVMLAGAAYAEHMHHWQRAGHRIERLTEQQLDQLQAGGPLPAEIDVLLLVNPTNPTGRLYQPAQLRAWHQQLVARGGWLVVDEAFMDMTPQYSLAELCPLPGLIVLRSVGKFFGLAGARAGFVLAEPELLHRLAAELGPWTLSGPSRWYVAQALRDVAWHQAQRVRLRQAAQRLQSLLAQHGFAVQGATDLFQYCPGLQARQQWHALREQAVLVRYFSAESIATESTASSDKQLPALRFGLPGCEAQWQHLQRALYQLSHMTERSALS